jgi:hypothetical protein
LGQPRSVVGTNVGTYRMQVGRGNVGHDAFSEDGRGSDQAGKSHIGAAHGRAGNAPICATRWPSFVGATLSPARTPARSFDRALPYSEPQGSQRTGSSCTPQDPSRRRPYQRASKRDPDRCPSSEQRSDVHGCRRSGHCVSGEHLAQREARDPVALYARDLCLSRTG